MASPTQFLASIAASAGRMFAPAARPQGYMVCATPRSGSNYLCQLLASTGMLGVPREYFNAPGRRRYDDPNYPEDPQAQLAQIRTTGATPNGIYGVKAHPFQLMELAGTLDPFTALPGLVALRLKRIDGLGQAISWSRVQQTGQHRASDAPVQPAQYDAEHIRQCRRFIDNQNRYWRKHLRKLGIKPLKITYEDLYRDPQGQIERVAAFLRLREKVRIDPSLISVSVQRDQLTEEWRRRFLAESGEAPTIGRAN